MRPAKAELFHADEQTDRKDMTNLIVSLYNSTIAPKKMNSVLNIFCDPENGKLLTIWKDETTSINIISEYYICL